MKVLFITAELFPLVKTGGLADYSEAIPKTMHAANPKAEVRVMLPAYPSVMKAMKSKRVIVETESLLKTKQKIQIVEGKVKGFPFPILAVNVPHLYNREGNPYVDSSGNDWADNFQRFATLSMAPYLMIKQGAWIPDVVHANDWHTGLFGAYLSLLAKPPRTLFTIHNMAFQGIFPKRHFFESGLPDDMFHIGGVEFFDKLSFMKAGINFSNKVVTVSPRYALEVSSQDEFGLGCCGILTEKGKDFVGILNGVDYKVWSPQKDQYLQYNYSSKSKEEKQKQKKHFQQSIGLEVSSDSFLISSVSRLSYQKGLDMAISVLREMIPLFPRLQFVCVGTGDGNQEKELTQLSLQYPKQLRFFATYDETLAHQAIGSSDAFLMPSRFEPCGLTQIYSLKYGTIPLVTPVGGLLDTVQPYAAKGKKNMSGTGFIASSVSEDAIKKMIQQAQDVFLHQPEHWQKLMQNAMKQDFSWKKSEEVYEKLYAEMLRSA